MILRTVAQMLAVGRAKGYGIALFASVSFSLGLTDPTHAQVSTAKTETISWRATDRGQILKEQTWQYSGSVFSVAFSPDGRQVLTGSADNTAMLRDIQTGRTLQTWQHSGTVSSVAFSPDGRQVLTGSWDNTAVLRDIQTGRTLQTWQHSGPVFSVAFSPDGRQVLTGSWDKTAVLRDIQTGRTLQTWQHSGPVFSVAFSPDGRQVLTGSGDKTAVLRDVQTGGTLQTWQHSQLVSSVAFSPDGRQVLTSSEDHTAVLRDVQTGRTLQTWQHSGWVGSIAFSPDGRQVLTGSGLNVTLRPSGVSKKITLPDGLKVSIETAESAHRTLPKPLSDRQASLEATKPTKDEFESTAQFNARVAQWNKAVEALNADIQAHYAKLGPLPLSLRAKAFEQAISDAYGNPELHEIRYDPETARFFATLKASFDPDFKRTLSIPVPNDQARAAKEVLESGNNGLEIELRVTEQNELIWGQPKVNLNGRVVLAQYTDKDFVPPTTQVASTPALQPIAPPPIATLSPGPAPQISTDPNLAKLQMEVLQREREQAEAAARQAEEKRLRDRLAELNRLAAAEFKDDLPGLLAKIPVAKPNPRVHVLAIGINDYADVPDVPFADRSAQQFAQIAERLLGAQKQNVIVLTNAEATSGRLRGRLRTLLNRLGPQDQLLFYYAGHGVPGKDGKTTYLLAQDGTSGSYEEPDLQLEQLYAAVAKSQVGKAKLFIDACFSGRSDKNTIVFDGVAPITVTPKQSFPASDRLAVLTAGRGDQFANQEKERGHRLFGYHLMRVILEEGPKLELAQIHSQLRKRVLEDSKRIGPEYEQEPELQGNGRLAILN
jgi:hypothetical protein